MRLTQEQAAIRETARQFSAREIAPYVRAWEKNQETPRALYKAMGEAGLRWECVLILSTAGQGQILSPMFWPWRNSPGLTVVLLICGGE